MIYQCTLGLCCKSKLATCNVVMIVHLLLWPRECHILNVHICSRRMHAVSPNITIPRYFMLLSASYVNFPPCSRRVSSISSWSRLCISGWTANWWEAKDRSVDVVSSPTTRNARTWAAMSSSFSSVKSLKGVRNSTVTLYRNQGQVFPFLANLTSLRIQVGIWGHLCSPNF